MSLIRAVAKLVFVVVTITACLPAASSYADDNVVYASNTGSGTSCTVAQPCGIVNAIEDASTTGPVPGRVICLNAVVGPSNIENLIGANNQTLEIDCPLGFLASLQVYGTNGTTRVRGLTFTRSAFTYAIFHSGSGTLILEDCTFVDESAEALDLEPSGPLNLVIRNARISNGGAGILLKPAAGGSITATLDHVTIADNSGGGIRIDTTNGPVTIDIADSVVSENGGNGINAVGNAGGQAMVSIKNSVIAKNGTAGVQANGANAGVLVQTTLFDQNANGATSAVNGGHVSTYGNNSIVGSSGSGFTGSAGLQ